jgi:hypothetical protein
MASDQFQEGVGITTLLGQAGDHIDGLGPGGFAGFKDFAFAFDASDLGGKGEADGWGIDAQRLANGAIFDASMGFFMSAGCRKKKGRRDRPAVA